MDSIENYLTRHGIEVFENYSEPQSTNPLEYAYQGLLEQRNNLVIPMANETVSMSEDDLLINKNLQTANLFNRLNEEFKQKQIKLDEYNSQLNSILEIPTKIYTNMDTLKKIYMSNHVESLAGLNEVNTKLTNYFNEINSVVSDIIRRKIASLEGEIDDITRKLNALRSLIVTGVNEIVKPNDREKKMCPVCFDNEVNTALVPCGHTYCKGCAETDRSRYAKCPQCRAQINARVKIFFSI
uniref:RING-type domain-containing protein n=1 Tax=viral metagenome TaxID=1070528 RepID=A0A6C0DK00_9ZZZZ